MENFVDPFLLVLTLALTICLIFGNIYFLAHYSHHSDSFFGSSTACKAVLVSAFIMSHLGMAHIFFFTDIGGRLLPGVISSPDAMP